MGEPRRADEHLPRLSTVGRDATGLPPRSGIRRLSTSSALCCYPAGTGPLTTTPAPRLHIKTMHPQFYPSRQRLSSPVDLSAMGYFGNGDARLLVVHEVQHPVISDPDPVALPALEVPVALRVRIVG